MADSRWVCPACGGTEPSHLTACRFCGTSRVAILRSAPSLDLRPVKPQPTGPMLSLPPEQPAGPWRCSGCASTNMDRDQQCSGCGRSRQATPGQSKVVIVAEAPTSPENGGSWRCAFDTSINTGQQATCILCGRSRRAAPVSRTVLLPTHMPGQRFSGSISIPTSPSLVTRAEDAIKPQPPVQRYVDVLRNVAQPGGLERLKAMASDALSEIERTVPTVLASNSREVLKSLRHTSTSSPVEPCKATCRARSLMQQAKWLEAARHLSGVTEPGAVPEVRALQAFCYFQLTGLDAQAGIEGALVWAQDHPVAALVRAQMSDAEDARELDELKKDGLRSHSFAQALIYVLHSASARMPATLREIAMSLLAKHGPGIGASTADQSPFSGPQPDGLKLPIAGGSEALRELDNLIGLSQVKVAFAAVHAMVELDRERGINVKERQYGAVFVGNPGTGKTTVARLYARLLQECRVLPSSKVEETSGSRLVSEGVNKLKQLLMKLEDGGLLFIDEAYQLQPNTNAVGAEVINFLLPEIENQRGKLVVVLAGYQKPMEDLLAFNEGMPSRFHRVFRFEDYSENELTAILTGIVDSSKPRFKVADAKILRIACRRLGRMRDSRGFGNARALRNLYEVSLERQAARLQRMRAANELPREPKAREAAMLTLERDDILGPRALDPESCSALKELDGLVGLQAVKTAVRDLLQLVKTNAELEELEEPVHTVNLNRVFLGNPGTGKTTVAGIYGRILRELGLLTKGEVMVRNPSDFIGAAVGESEKQTNTILQASQGCILVIDEAYGFHIKKGATDPYRVAAIETIVAKVQGVPGDDRCVLLLGYREQMMEMFREANSGLSRRFQLEDAWVFEDYDDAALLKMLVRTVTRRGLTISMDTAIAAVDVLTKERMMPTFGNAGAVNNLVSRAVSRMQRRLAPLSPAQRAKVKQLDLTDFEISQNNQAPFADIFEDLVGCSEVLRKLKEYQATITACQQRGEAPLNVMELCFRFVGSPGTGKTTVARRMGMLFHSLGILGTSEVVECSAGNFVTGFANQAAGKTRDIFESAQGKVLFVDEAYRLDPRRGGPMVSEALDEIVQVLTEPRFKQKLVFILAGYESDIDRLMTCNAGLKSRLSEKLRFADFTADEACGLMQRLLDRKGFRLTPTAEESLPALMRELMAAPAWSNGRDVDTWVKRSFRHFSIRRIEQDTNASMGDDSTMTVEDLRLSLNDLLESKREVNDQLPELEGYIAPQRAASASAVVPKLAANLHTEVNTNEALLVEDNGARHDQAALEWDLPQDFLDRLQAALDKRNITTMEHIEQLLSQGIPSDLLSELGPNTPLVQQLATRWEANWREKLKEKEMQERREKDMQEQKIKARVKRAVWRCHACGRYGCPVAPYIESWVEDNI